MQPCCHYGGPSSSASRSARNASNHLDWTSGVQLGSKVGNFSSNAANLLSAPSRPRGVSLTSVLLAGAALRPRPVEGRDPRVDLRRYGDRGSSESFAARRKNAMHFLT